MTSIDQTGIFLKRVLNVYKTEGPRGLFIRIKDRFRSNVIGFHTFVLELEYCPTPHPSTIMTEQDPLVVRAKERAQRFLDRLEFKQITLADTAEIEELTVIDPWNIPKWVTVEKLRMVGIAMLPNMKAE